MKIDIIKIEIHNFMSFADEIFDFSEQTGINRVTGKNLDIQDSKNGAGKCLDPLTNIVIETDDQEFINWFKQRK